MQQNVLFEEIVGGLVELFIEKMKLLFFERLNLVNNFVGLFGQKLPAVWKRLRWSPSAKPDRQPEFTQLDLKLSFTSQEMPDEITPKPTIPFPRMSHHEAMDKFGTDKPLSFIAGLLSMFSLSPVVFKDIGSDGFFPRFDFLSHHPFTAPIPEHFEKLCQGNDLDQIEAQHYDLVLNGIEIGGGSIRIHNSKVQRVVMEQILKLKTEELEHFINALSFGKLFDERMAFVGHPILADIRKGFRLRPTQTVDKSKPIIQAEGEQLTELLQNRSPSPAALPQAKANGVPKATKAPPMTQQKNEAKRQQQTMMAKPSPKNIGNGQSVSADQRQKMLAQIRSRGVRLRHVQTADKSGLIWDEQQKCTIGTRNGAASPQSLNSQGKSPSPRTTPSSSSSSSSTPSSSSASAFSPTPISAGNRGGCWHRSPSGDSSDSVPLANGCAAVPLSHPPTEHFGHHSDHTDHCSDHFHHLLPPAASLLPLPFLSLPSPLSVSFSSLSPQKMAVGRVPSPTPPAKCNSQKSTTVIRVGGKEKANGGGKILTENQPKTNSDFQFDERQQILERREEVASLCAQRAKIVAFRKLQQRHQQQTEAVSSSSYCTLPRKTKAQTQHRHWHAMMAYSGDGDGTFPPARANCVVSEFEVGVNERNELTARRAQSPADWHGTKWPQASTMTTKIEVEIHENANDRITQVKQQQQHHEKQNAKTLPNSKMRWRSPSPQRRNVAPPLLHRSASSSMTNFPLAEPSSASIFRPFGQRVSVGGAHRQHFERIRQMDKQRNIGKSNLNNSETDLRMRKRETERNKARKYCGKRRRRRERETAGKSGDKGRGGDGICERCPFVPGTASKRATAATSEFFAARNSAEKAAIRRLSVAMSLQGNHSAEKANQWNRPEGFAEFGRRSAGGPSD
ncbi:hypothetical protein niasHT_018330 [Heterodera trifolii]|uniref:WH2 domain-containing protein n=1 Tax=Heterodera trifolii TaxID=157864 RepID=A0ABD2L376_9BILA